MSESTNGTVPASDVPVANVAKSRKSRSRKQTDTEASVAGSRMLGVLVNRNTDERNKGRRSVVTTDPDTGAEVTLSVGVPAVTRFQWREAAKDKGLTVSYDDDALDSVQEGADNNGLQFTKYGEDAEAYLDFVSEECEPPSAVASDNDSDE